MTGRHPLDWFFVLRPTLLIPVCTTFLAGISGHATGLSSIQWVLLLTGAFALGGSVYLVNVWKDRESDAINQKLFYLDHSIFTPTIAITYAIMLALIGFLLLLFVAHTQFIPILIGFFITAILYNLPPFRFKDRAGADIVSTMIAGGLAWWFGFMLADRNTSEIYQIVPYVFAFGGASLWTQIPDIDGDKRTGKHTLAVRAGEGKTFAVGQLLVLLSFISALLIGEWIIGVPSLLTLLVCAITRKKKWPERAGISARFAILSLSLAVGLYYPLYWLAMIVYYFFARWYYRMRFDINYPSFSGSSW